MKMVRDWCNASPLIFIWCATLAQMQFKNTCAKYIKFVASPYVNCHLCNKSICVRLEINRANGCANCLHRV